MKSQFQTLSFLANYVPKTSLDAEFINSFLVQRFQVTPKTPIFSNNPDAAPIDVQSFISWFENGYNALQIAKHGTSIVLLGNCTIETCDIIGTLQLPCNTSGECPIITDRHTLSQSDLQKASEDEIALFYNALLSNNLQPDPNTLTLIPKYLPKNGDRVAFYDYSQEIQGVGVINYINAEGDVVFYCYFTYPTANSPKKVGYSLREAPGYNIRNIVFENIDKENIQTTLGNSTSCFRRLGRELEKMGKVWKDKLLRIEPLKAKLPIGSKYYYITDKMEVRQETEKGTPTSHMRYLAGNYFVDHQSAMVMLGKFNDMLRDFLASDEWPKLQ